MRTISPNPALLCNRDPRVRSLPRGFTLVELLVAIVIFSILVTIAIGAFSESDSDRASAAAQQLRSMLEGAHSRAIRDQQIRGIQLIRGQGVGHFTAIQYVGAPRMYEGTLSNIQRTSGEWEVSVAGTEWTNLVRRGLMATESSTVGETGLRIEIPSFSGHWYTLSVPNVSDLSVATLSSAKLQGHYLSSVWDPTLATPNYQASPATNVPYRLELIPPPLPGSQPQQLADKIAISATASSGLTGDTIYFAPRGSVIGANANAGLIHFYLGDVSEIATAEGTAGYAGSTRVFGDPPGIQKSDRVITVFTRTGLMTSSAVDHSDGDADGWADSPFSYARTGGESK